MNHIRHIRRLAAVLAGALSAFAGAAPVALARPAPPRHKYAPMPPGWWQRKHPPLPYGHWTGAGYQFSVRTVMVGGMPGWQIALIAVGAALLAATTAVVVYRAWATRRNPVTAAV